MDGAEQPLSTLLSNKYYEVCKYVTLDAHSYNIPTLLFSANTWNRCSDELKAVMHTAWDECLVEMRPEIEGYQLELINTFKGNGMEVIEVTDGQAWADAMKPVYDEFAVGLESLVEEIRAAK